MSGNISTIGCGGVDTSKYMIDQIYVSKKDPSKLEKVKVPWYEAIGSMPCDYVETTAARMMNPINFFWKYTGNMYSCSKRQRA